MGEPAPPAESDAAAGSPAAAAPTSGAPPEAPAWGQWLLAAAVLATYANALAGSFQFDDWNVIVDEPRVATVSAWWASMPGIRPVLKLSYAANRASGLGLAGFHAVNLAVHVASALLAWALLRRIAARLGAPPAAALLGALSFALHPVQTEAVTYVSGRSSSLAGALALGSALAWLEGRERRATWLWAGLSPLLMALSLGVKETALVLPVALLLLGAVAGPRAFSRRRALPAISPHLLVLVAAAGAFLASPAYRRMVSRSLELRDPWANLLTHVDALGWLAGQIVRLDRLNADPALPAVTSLSPSVALAGLGLLSALAAGLALLRRRPAVAFGVLWFLLWLPATGWWLPRPEPASERQLYLALLGPAWLAGLALAPWLAAGTIRRTGVVALVAALGTATVLRNRAYRSEVAFWEDVVSRSPHNARAHNNLGVALAGRCLTLEAEAAFRRALEADPGHFRAAVNLELLSEGRALGPRAPPCPGMR